MSGGYVKSKLGLHSRFCFAFVYPYPYACVSFFVLMLFFDVLCLQFFCSISLCACVHVRTSVCLCVLLCKTTKIDTTVILKE